ncbi:MAG: DUF3293 domain-containing protein [Pirellulaceae bacterium]
MEPNISPELLAAYKATRFTAVVDGEAIEIRVGQVCPALNRYLEKTVHASWAFVTASNPASVELSAPENDDRHSQLKGDVAAMGYAFFEGEGVPESGDWEPEQSLLILGIPCDDAKQLGRKYGQNAIVAGRRSEPAALVICGEEPAAKCEHAVQPDLPPGRETNPSGREPATQIESEDSEGGPPYDNTKLGEIE